MEKSVFSFHTLPSKVREMTDRQVLVYIRRIYDLVTKVKKDHIKHIYLNFETIERDKDICIKDLLNFQKKIKFKQGRIIHIRITLEIGHLQYNISNQTINTTTCSVLTLLSQLYDAPSLNEKNKKQKTGMDSKYPIVARHNLKWFYKYWPLECYVDYNMGALKLSKEGTDTALEYYQKFHLNKASKVLKDNRFYYGHVPLVKRKCELNRGYAELRFGKIETSPVICPTKY
ncbi:hypothetical protein PHYBLDRAFT_168597 [Phycomyces blakesleeanus NRRL 1555(-)]|uniref:Uncharacterized protein n=1 Tax=Phycomyces blakesleeanus (strain ATCC 8743b / DSM 1359 / FGSC 10004 / NBRC 33097 / NRRL 1555) TaxID=763407 RepID=A0A162X8P6_PHYB8|nr:hypothetical protein PHYBLDRAFT_168597 [Phycomyces blakesleeanus NRRL 1555(-)]OAD73245.1 hypothetical protein PHYBLDRAFT_168597 [Phycomyces blakesleeanus NRRL 1555(-)]|eukprot:XP_018291285.1 hypothetical protein PHYBLDRAFT_168597 [Phycomyces blakesleeanus NRRL 1555(-)]